ncbi:MAG: ABC transporter substrate-binding protein [Melioribacteraceae bacterium]|nr:ABC transporter substrate-binding protein [Melioribacteraceae bacterium]
MNKFFLLILLSLLISCTNQNDRNETANRSGTSIFKDKLVINYSDNFKIEYFDSVKIVTVLSSDSLKKVMAIYLLAGDSIKNIPTIPNAQVIRTPIKSIAVLTSIYIGFLEKLNLLDKVMAVDNINYIFSPLIHQKYDEEKVKEVGDANNMNIEKIFALNPGIVFTYGNGNPHLDGSEKLIRNNIPIASSTIHLETSSLARAEWIKFIAAFFDKEKEANEVFTRIEARYNELKVVAKRAKINPTVFTEAIFGGTWYVPGGKSFMASLLTDAGANYIWKGNNDIGSLKLSFEQVYEKANSADFWINVLFWKNMEDVSKNDPRNIKFKAFKTGNIYNNNASINENGLFEYWENGVVNCDLVLADLIKIFHPELLPGHQFKYYKKLQY